MVNPTQDTIYGEVLRWISDRTGVREEQIGPSTLLRDLVEDSLSFVDLVMAFEDEHGVDVRHPTARLDSVSDLVAYVHDLQEDPARRTPDPT
ncbi:MAG: acyl carrier protein [Fimbriimonas sp.]